MPETWDRAARAEMEWPETGLWHGEKSPAVRRLQEWLWLLGFRPGGIDGNYGAMTAQAVRKLQEARGLPATGAADVATLRAASGRMADAFAPLPPTPGGAIAVAAWVAAQQHLAASPHEIGGPNAGPWVRAYMRGRQGEDKPWCAGFVSTLVRQAAQATGIAPPFRLSEGCDEIARGARAAGRLFPADAAPPFRGAAIFLVRGARADDWTHTGLCVRGEGGDPLRSIEGNTNEQGGREGVAVRERGRALAGLDLALLEAP